MWPLKDKTLPLQELAELWAGSLPGHPVAKVVDDLLSAFWRSDLIAETVPAGDARAVLLGIAARQADHPGLLFIAPGEAAPPEIIDLCDGGALVDVRTRIHWPAPADADEADARRKAYETMAEVGLDAYSPTVAPLLSAIAISRAAFGAYCEVNGYALPAFWFAKRAAPGTSGAAVRCQRWLRAQVAKGDKPGSKAVLRKQAMKEIPDLKERAFDRAWQEVVPPDWKAGGRPRKAPR